MDAIDTLLTRGVDKVYPTKEKLEETLRSGKKLRLYQGFDPTGSQLHIGHAVGLRKMRQFQDLGHHVIFLIGDFTGMIGDPSGKSSERKVLTHEQVLANAASYKEQAARILRFDGENPVEIKYNSEWLGKMSAAEFISLSHHLTAAQVMERDMFQERNKKGQDVYMNEFLYPFMQGYDSVAMDVDLEIGGSDQMFNMMMGRKLMHNIKQKEKFVVTTPLLTDSQGIKIGKTEGNVIGLTDRPEDFYAKIMSLNDNAIVPCFTLLTDVLLEEIDEIKAKITSGDNPMVFKKQLAFELTKQFNNEEAAKNAEKNFIDVVVNRNQPTMYIPSVIFRHGEENCLAINLVLMTEVAKSKSEARRLIEQGAVEFNNTVLKSPNEGLTVKDGDIIKIGKKYFSQIKFL